MTTIESIELKGSEKSRYSLLDEKMFCIHCGKEIKEGEQFCSYCGTKVISGKAEKQKQLSEKTTGNKQKKKVKGVIFGIVGVCIILAIALAIVGGNTYLNHRENQFISSIEKYNISDYVEEKKDLDGKYKSENIFAIWNKIQDINDLEKLDSKAKKADSDLGEIKKELDKMAEEKDQYDLATSFSDYDKLISDCDSAIEDRELSKTNDLFEKAKTQLETVIADNDSYVEDKLEEYAETDWTTADATDKATYDENIQKIKDLKDSGNYGEMRSIFEKTDDIVMLYCKPDNPLTVQVQQIDAAAYPNVKLYVQFEDSNGNVPDDLKSGFFYVRKQDTKKLYIRQKIDSVSQLNESEALNIDMVADVSGSMEGEPIEEAKRLMNSFVNTVQFAIGDKVEITAFSTGVYLKQEFSGDADALNSCINSLQTSDMTSLYDALYTAVTRTAAQNGAKCVIAFTDGMDNYSNCTQEQVISLAQRYSVPIFIIGIGNFEADEVSKIADQTGGKYYAVGSVSSIKEIYDEIYKKEKELYMIEFTDETGSSMTDTSDVIVGYNSDTYGGQVGYSYTPNILLSVDGEKLYAEGPETVVEGYMKNFDDAVTKSDFSYISDYLKPGSSIYKEQEKYVQKDLTEQLETYEISNTDYISATECVITTRETYYVQKTGKPLDLLTQQCKYRLVYENSEWKMTEFADSVNVLSRIKQ